MPKTVIVIPCYGEEKRLPVDEVLSLATSSAEPPNLLLVDDGSKDGTLAVLRRIEAAAPTQVSVLPLPSNQGKAEAVRLGMGAAIEAGAELVGFADADMATPAAEILRLVGTLRDDPARVVAMGSRVARAGAHIDRSELRHYTGRVFSTLASLILAAPFYDTQCGAKVFRVNAALREALSAPFGSRWSFDVELLGRLMTAPEPVPFDAFVEVPLGVWREVGGSKLDLMGQLKATVDLLTIARALAARRRR